MKIENKIKNSLLNKNILVQRTASKNDIKKFLSRFREKYESIDLIRVGSKNDGGYLVPNYLQNIRYCFSPGVAETADFESQLSKEFDIKSYLADASVDSAPVYDKNFKFLKKFLGSRSHGEFITLSDWITESVPKSHSNKILQMDIEGAEYDVLTYESADTLAQFSVIIIEFHGLKNIYEKHFLRMLSAIFEKFYLNFSICHVHPNNSSSIETMGDIKIPKVIEVTFIHNDLIDQFSSTNEVFLPHILDEKNLRDLDDIIMPEIWWKKIM
tara:strand:+ start:449 stop:1258 length:810 start_codon:yes stop_codon:yes gene_type:complete